MPNDPLDNLKYITLANLKKFKELFRKETDAIIDKKISSLHNKFTVLVILYMIMNIAFGYMLDLQDQQILELENQIKVLRQEVQYATTLTATEETSIDGQTTQETQSVSESESDAGNDSVDN